MSFDPNTNPATSFFAALRKWAYPQVGRHTSKASFVAAVRVEAQRINAVGRHGRTPEQIDNAVTNCADWTWEKFVGDEATVSPIVDRDVRLRLPEKVDQLLRARAAALNVEPSELVTRWVVASLAAERATSADLLGVLMG